MNYADYQKIAALAEVEIERLGLMTHCILATRAMLHLLPAMGVVGAEPMKVSALVFNVAVVEFTKHHRRLPTTADYDANPMMHSVGIGVNRVPKPGCWPGHLVLVAPCKDTPPVLIDLTAGQASRPGQNMLVKSQVLPIPRGFITGSPASVAGNGVVVSYRASPHEKDYEEHPDWKDNVHLLSEPLRRLFTAHNLIPTLSRKTPMGWGPGGIGT